MRQGRTVRRMPSFVTWVLALCAVPVMAVTVSAAQRGDVETFPEPAMMGPEPLEELATQQKLHSWLISEMPAGVLDRPMRVTVTTKEIANLDLLDKEDPGRTLVGLTKPVGRRVEFSAVKNTGSRGRSMRTRARSFAGGTLRATRDGSYVWTVAITSEDAAAIRVHFTELNLPSSGDLYIYNLEGQAFGPYTRRGMDADGDQWSHAVRGDTAIIQLHLSGRVTQAELQSTRFVIADVGHIGPKFAPASSQESICSYNVSCIENAQCYGSGAWSEIENTQDATALMLWISGRYIYTCTGGLLADTDGSSQIPYFLTANHCLSRAKDAKNLETYFQYLTNCGGGCPSEWTGGGTQRLGAWVRASNRTGDYTLLELKQAPPSGSWYLGWTTANVANSNGTGLYRISHPATAPQAFSTHTVDTSAGTCSGWPRGSWIYSRDGIGGTEGGSSGSPVCNAAGQVVGQLSGGCGTNVNDACDSVNNATVDGAFASYFDSVAQYLAPGGGCTPSAEVCTDGDDNDCDGDVDCDDADCSGDPACASCNPSPEVCTDGQDNDCDDAVDCDDSDCSGDPACASSCGPVGDSCSSNSDCCSNKCRGRRGNKTCR